jgi:hypothetical protein
MIWSGSTPNSDKRFASIIYGKISRKKVVFKKKVEEGKE